VKNRGGSAVSGRHAADNNGGTQGSPLFNIACNVGKDISADGLDQQAIHLALDLFYLVPGKRLLMTAAGAFKGLSGHQEMVFADNLSLAGSAIEPDANTVFTVRKTDIWKYFHFSRPLSRRLNSPQTTHSAGKTEHNEYNVLSAAQSQNRPKINTI
jgi:hypothetical protein